jgi:homoserine kinase
MVLGAGFIVSLVLRVDAVLSYHQDNLTRAIVGGFCSDTRKRESPVMLNVPVSHQCFKNYRIITTA